MKFIGLFGASYFALYLGLQFIWPLFEHFYGIVGIAAFLIAFVLRMFMKQSERMDEMQVQLTLLQKELAALRKQFAQDNKEDGV